MDNRQIRLQHWLTKQLQVDNIALRLLTPGASNRRFFRFHHQQQTYIAIDAPSPTENSRQYVTVANWFTRIGITAPTIMAADTQQGFLWTSDLGNNLFLSIT